MSEAFKPLGLDPSQIVRRPVEVLRGLSLPHQWEVTRRHPYYLLSWQYARRYMAQESANQEQRALDQVFAIVLHMIGAWREFPDPHTSARDFSVGMQAGWLNGAIAPLSYGTLLGLLLQGLPERSRGFARSCVDVYWKQETEDFVRMDLLHWVTVRSSEDFDRHVPHLINVNIQAPIDDILKSVEKMVGEWKRAAGAPSRRRRSDKVEDYLRVWDMREGWKEGCYDIEKEMTLKEIAKELRCAIPTVMNRYQSAFKLIVGHDYTPELWLRLIGAYKFCMLGAGRRSSRRPRSSRHPASRRIIVATNIGTTFDLHEQAVDSDEAHRPRIDNALELLMRIQRLMKEGRSNEQIADEVDLVASRIDHRLVQWVREHEDEIPAGIE